MGKKSSYMYNVHYIQYTIQYNIVEVTDSRWSEKHLKRSDKHNL